jgi:hypothetical protein
MTESVSELTAGDHGPVTIPITVVSGQNLAKGTVLARITVGGKYTAYDDDGTDNGTRTAVAILAVACNASSGDEKSHAIVHGEVLASALTGLDTAGQLDLLAAGIYVK